MNCSPLSITDAVCREVRQNAVALDRFQRLLHNHVVVLLSEADHAEVEPILPFWSASITANLDRTVKCLNDAASLRNRLARTLRLRTISWLRTADRWKVEFLFDDELPGGEVKIVTSLLGSAPASGSGAATVPYQPANATMPAGARGQAAPVRGSWLRFEFTDRNGSQRVDTSALLVTAGRDPSCTVVVADRDDQISRTHLECRLLGGGQAEVRSVGQHGSVMEGVPLSGDWAPLPRDCEVEIGDTRLRLTRI